MADGDITPPEADGQSGPEASPGVPPRPPEPQTPGQQAAAEAEAEAREEGPAEALQDLAQGVNETAAGLMQPNVNIAPLREAPQQDQLPEAEAPVAPEPTQDAGPQTGAEATAARAQAEALADQYQATLHGLREMPPEQFSAELQRATIVEQQLRESATTRSNLSENQRQEIINEWRRARSELAILQSVASERAAGSTNIQRSSQLRQRERQRAERIADLQTKNVGELQTKNETAQSVVRTLEQRLTDEQSKPTNEQDQELIQGIRDELIEAKGEAEEVKTIYEQKTTQEETQTTQEERETQQKTLEDLRREAAKPPQLRTEISGQETRITSLEGEIATLDMQIQGARNEARRKILEDKKAASVKDLVELREKLKKNKDILENALKRERDEFTLAGRMSKDTLRRVSREEYLQWDEEQRAKYLQEIMEVTRDADESRIRKIQNAIGVGEPLSIEDRAQYARYLADRIITSGGRGDLELEYFQGIAAEYPEMANAIFDRVTRSETAKKTLKEKFPNNWEKMINFAKKHPGWILILLAILAAPAAAAAVVVAPAAGVGVGLTGAGGAAGGAGWFGGRDRR